MVQRSGFYVENDCVIQRIVKIEWDLGFDWFAKQKYIERIRNVFGTDKGKLLDVTSASNNDGGRTLSPLFVKMKSRGCTVEDFLQAHPELLAMRSMSDYLYLSNLSDFHKNIISNYDCFSDVFHNPDKQYGNTQACSLAVYKLMQQQDKLELLEDYETFRDFYETIDFRKEVL